MVLEPLSRLFWHVNKRHLSRGIHLVPIIPPNWPRDGVGEGLWSNPIRYPFQRTTPNTTFRPFRISSQHRCILTNQVVWGHDCKPNHYPFRRAALTPRIQHLPHHTSTVLCCGTTTSAFRPHSPPPIPLVYITYANRSENDGQSGHACMISNQLPTQPPPPSFTTTSTHADTLSHTIHQQYPITSSTSPIPHIHDWPIGNEQSIIIHRDQSSIIFTPTTLSNPTTPPPSLSSFSLLDSVGWFDAVTFACYYHYHYGFLIIIFIWDIVLMCRVDNININHDNEVGTKWGMVMGVCIIYPLSNCLTFPSQLHPPLPFFPQTILQVGGGSQALVPYT